MTQAEFKAWFEGFTEAFDKAPTQKQWARIKARVAEIDGQPVTERIYVDRYWPSYAPYYRYYPYTNPTFTTSGLGVGANSGTLLATGTVSLNASALSQMQFSPTGAMYALGQAEAAGEA